MPLSNYIKITIDGVQVDMPAIDKIPLTLSYALEDRESFQEKKSGRSLNLSLPSTAINDQVANNFSKAESEDLTPDNRYRGNRRGIIEVNGQELLVGKAFLTSAKHQSRPTGYEYDFYGDNADWAIDLKETTLYDFVKDIIFKFTKNEIIRSWGYDGTDPNMPYVFAPVRYGQPMATLNTIDPVTNRITNSVEDYNMLPEYMRPAISKYWILFKAFKSLGYRIQSDFLDSDYFRRQVMPWTWGNFLISDGTTLENLNFLAKSSVEVEKLNESFTGFWNVKADNSNINGAFNNNGVYSYDGTTYEMKWTYNPAFNLGTLTAYFYLNMFLDAVVTAASDVEVRAQWFLNGAKINHGFDDGNGTFLINMSAPLIGKRSFTGPVEDWASFDVNPGDVVSCKIYLHTFKSDAGIARIHGTVDTFKLDYFRIPMGGTINFSSYEGFKKYKFLDFFKGVVDEFNLCFKADPVNKTIYAEPMHPYSLQDNQAVKVGGYFNGRYIDWTLKQDLTKESEMIPYSDNERELTFKYQDDKADGTYNIIQDRNLNTPGSAKYVFPNRFKAGNKTIENRFFSTVMHFDVIQWKGLAGDAYPQMICLIPENISNTSRDEAQNTFKPKSAYYKGIVTNVGGWMFDGKVQYNFPYMFAVNYRNGGEEDPVLSYCDEQVGAGALVKTAKGLVRRFYLQRLSIMENGQYYKTYFKLNNNDVANILHREHIICEGQRWEIVEINNYAPLREESTEVILRKWSPIKHG